MSGFLAEAFFIGVKEGVKVYVCIFIILSFFRNGERDYPVGPFFAGLIAVSLASFLVIAIHVTAEMRDIIVKMIGYVFGIFYLFSLGALYHASGTDILGPLKRVCSDKLFLIPFVFLLTCVYFIPDMAGASLYVGDMFSLAGDSLSVFFASIIGFLGALLFGRLISRRIQLGATRVFGLPQVFLLLALIKLIGGGVKGFAELSLIPSVQKGLMKLIHDAVHQMFLFVMVPDHLLLKVTTWNFIGIFFGDGTAVWLSLIVLLAPLFIFLKKHFTAEIGVPHDIGKGSMRRKFIKSVKDERFLKSIPVFIFAAFILSTWFMEKDESAAKLYNPEPVPLVAEKEKALILIRSPGKDLRDGKLHKFALNIKGEDVRILVMKKDDGTLCVCLDACEICPPEGYAQGEGHVICLYCMTPIAVETLGQPGGCNPIPLRTHLTDTHVLLDVSEILKRWNMVRTGKTREEINK